MKRRVTAALEKHGRAHQRVAVAMTAATQAFDQLHAQLAPIAHIRRCPVCSGVPRRHHAYCHEGNLLHRRSLGEDT